jgi:hypothetical protein
MRLRLHGTPAECQAATRRLAEVFDVVAVSPPSPDRGQSRSATSARQREPRS